jgi:hypothetical protein
MDGHDPIKQLLDECVQMLKDDGWTETKYSHFRKEGVPNAIEVGYVYGECTIRFQRLGGRSGQVDTGTAHTMRGHDMNLKIDLASHLDQLSHGAVFQ